MSVTRKCLFHYILGLNTLGVSLCSLFVILSSSQFLSSPAAAQTNSNADILVNTSSIQPLRIDQANWQLSSPQTTLLLSILPDGSRVGSAPQVSNFAKSTHIKVTFDNTLLSHPIAKISPRGIVKAAFVTQSYAANSVAKVNLDLFLTQPGQVIIDSQADGIFVHVANQPPNSARATNNSQNVTGAQIASKQQPQVQTKARTVANNPRLVLNAVPNTPPSSATMRMVDEKNIQALRSNKMQIANEGSFFDPNQNKGLPGLARIEPITLDDGTGGLELHFSGPIPDLKHFLMSAPHRVIIDMMDTPNRSGDVAFDINRGLFTKAKIVTSTERLRLILNLKQSARFEAEAIKSGYRLTAYGASPLRPTNLHQYPTLAEVQAQIRSSNSAANNGDGTNALVNGKLASIAGVDFRRSSEGHGRVIVNLNDPNVVVNFEKRADELVATFVNATLNAKNEKRLDVIDFATPVESVDLLRNGSDVQLVVTPQGPYKQNIIQTDNTYIIDVSPLSSREMLALEENENGFQGETLSLNFQSIPVRAALQVIADFTGLNIITSDSVKGDLSLRLNDVPWDQALDLILKTKNLSMRQTGNVIRVAPSKELAAQERRAFEAKQEVGALEPLITALIRVNYAKAEDIGALLKSVKAVDTGIQQSAFGAVTVNELKTEENSLLSARGSVTVDKRTNTLLIQDTASRISELRKLISDLDIPIKQIQIETRIVEATDDFSRALGARLGFLRITDNAQIPGSSDSNGIGTIFGSGKIENNNSVRVDNEITYPDDLSINLPADPLNGESPASYAYQIVKIGAGYLNLLDLELSALQAEGKGKIIANPKITTTDKHEARIEQGQERVFSSSSLLQGGTTTKKAVLGLVVTPQVTPDNQIILDVKITNDSFAAADTLNTKQIETQILLRNGETVVIGGIYQQAQSDTVTKTPILGDIPVLGHLFKKRTKRDNRTELLVFLTPRIINPDFR